MLLKATEQSDTGLNTKFVNVESGRTVTLKHAIKQIENGNKNYSDYLGIYVGSSEHMSDDIVSIPTRLGDPDVYADYKYHQNVLLFVFPCELKDLNERRELLLRSFVGERLYNNAEASIEGAVDENL